MTTVQLSPWVTHELLDDEVIAINLETGAYYALDGTAASCWTVVAAGGGVVELVADLTARYDVAPDTAEADAQGYLAALVAEGLAVAGPAVAGPAVDGPVAEGAGTAGPDVATPPSPPAAATRRAYVAPVVARYDDLDDLLLLDPIHEVDEAGWPIARAE